MGSIRNVEIFISLFLYAEHVTYVYRHYEDELEVQFPKGPKSLYKLFRQRRQDPT